MAFRGIDSERTQDYVSPRDPDKSNPTVFKLRSPGRRIQNWIRDRALAALEIGREDQTAEISAPFTMLYEYVRFGLVGLVNYADHQGNPMDFAVEHTTVPNVGRVACVSTKIMDTFDDDLIQELAAEIQSLCGASEEEAKNSEGSS